MTAQFVSRTRSLRFVPVWSALCVVLAVLAAANAARGAVRVEGGAIAEPQPDATGVRSFKGIPFAAPPVGELRWRAPQPAASWKGERKADQFGPRCTQSARLGNIDPLNPRMSEDCLYLNVWTPAKSAEDRLPVMVWVHGGSFLNGAGSEPWYDGTNLARKGVVVVTFNYRLDVFGFLAHPDLTAESSHHASGNYGLMDQMAALGWVKRNISAFGGDPGRVTVFGQSSGAMSISALMASPLGRGLFQRAIGESGAVLFPEKSRFELPRLAVAEKAGVTFAEALSAHSAAALRAIPAKEMLAAAEKSALRISRLPVIEGYVLPTDAVRIFSRGEQADVPLLAGSTADEWTQFAGRVKPPPTPEAYARQVRASFGDQADAVLAAYPGATPEQARTSFLELLGDQVLGYPTWLWDELQKRTGKALIYRYFFDLRPPAPEKSIAPFAAPGVFHSADIVYVFDNLQVRTWPWRPEDRHVAEMVSSYWVNFARNGDPNGPGLPNWPAYGQNGAVMRLGTQPVAGKDPYLTRYEVLNDFYFAPSK